MVSSQGGPHPHILPDRWSKSLTITLIGGPNGAGKTTTAFSIMPELIDCYEYVNADAIAAALSPFKPLEVSIEAGRVMLKRIKELANSKVDFAFETTLASRSFAPFLNACKKEGYSIRLIYVWLRSADLAVERVRLRVKSGGHFVPEKIIRQRYERSLKNLFKLYLPIADQWWFYDNSLNDPTLVARRLSEKVPNIFNRPIWNTLKENYDIE